MPRPEVIYNDEILRKHGLRDPACSYHLESPGRVGGLVVMVMVDVESPGM